MHYDVLIVGGGVVGCALARELTKYRLAVALVEREAEVGFGTSKANSGIIHGGHHAAPSTLKGRLEWKGNQMWDALCAQLSFGFKRVGELTVALTPEQVPTLERLLQQGRTKGVPGLELWDRARTLAAEPNLSTDVVAALHAPTTGVINPYEAVFGLAESAANNGCAMHVNCAVTGLEPVAVIGRGTGIDDAGWSRKTAAVRDALHRARPARSDPVGLLAVCGGADLAAMAGFCAQAAVRRTPVLLDGLVVTAASLIAEQLAPGARKWWQAGHRSPEPAHTPALAELGLEPVVDLGLRLGEGTGAAVALPVLRAAVATLAEMATFPESGVSGPGLP